MNTRTFGLGDRAEQAASPESRRDHASFVMELGTVTNETKQILSPVDMDNPLTPGAFGS
jgi:hypothetical protein